MKNRKPDRKKPTKNAKRKIHKKKPSPKNKIQGENYSSGISTPDMENINHVLYIHKSERADGRGSWKVVPKDSREVYRKRLRNQKRRRNELREENEENSAETPSDEEDDRDPECQCSSCKRRKKRRGDSSSSSRSSYSNSSSRRSKIRY